MTFSQQLALILDPSKNTLSVPIYALLVVFHGASLLPNHTPKERRCIDRRFDGPKHLRTRDYDSDDYGGGFFSSFMGGFDPDANQHYESDCAGDY